MSQSYVMYYMTSSLVNVVLTSTELDKRVKGQTITSGVGFLNTMATCYFFLIITGNPVG